MSSLRTRLLWSALSGILARLWTLGGWLLLVPWMLSQLGAEAFGVWSLVFLLGSYFSAGDLGLSSAVTRMVAEFAARGELHRVRKKLSQAIGLYAVLTPAWATMVWAFQDSWIAFLKIPPELVADARWILWLSPLLLLALGLQGLAGGVLGGLQRTDLVNRNQALASIPTFLGVVVCLLFHLGLPALFMASVCGGITGAILNWTEASSRGVGLLPRPSLPSRSFFADLGWLGARIQIITLAGLFHFQLDKLLLAHFRGLATVSDYELGFRLATLVMSFPLLTLPALMPASAHLIQSGRGEDLRRLYLDGGRLLCLFALPVTGLGIAVAPAVIEGWLGTPHEAATLTARLLLAGFAVNVWTGVGTAIARGSRYLNWELLYSVATQVVHIVLSLWLIPRIGLTGALSSQVAAQVFGTLLFLALIHGPLKISGAVFARRVVIGPAVVGLIAFFTAILAMRVLPGGWAGPGRLSVLLQVGTAAGLGLLISVAVAAALRVVRMEDLRILRPASRRVEESP